LPTDQLIVVGVVLLLIVFLYKEWINPALSFAATVGILLTAGILTPGEALAGLSNQHVAVIFMLMLITSAIRELYGGSFFSRLFDDSLSPRRFLIKLIMASSTTSAFLNNTPIVTFLVPYVKDWSERNHHPASKFLIPLSHATIAGGMITVIGTSTNLILQGLLSEYKLPLLQFTDFLYLGLIVTVLVWLYYVLIGYRLLPSHRTGIEALKTNIKEYIVEAEIFPGSSLAGKTVMDAGLRNLRDLFLVEVIRGNKTISPVSPDEVLEEEDVLFFSGNTKSILNLIRKDYGLGLLRNERDPESGQFHFMEAVVPANSELVGTRIRESDFRSRFKASIIAIHRNGKRVSGRVGETMLVGGDFLLLLVGADQITRDERNLFVISSPTKIITERKRWHALLGPLIIVCLAAGVIGFVPLFTSCLLIMATIVGLKVLTISDIRKQLDLNLLTVLASALAVGAALVKSGSADTLASWLTQLSHDWGLIPALITLFVSTTIITSLITNAATVAIMFPIALSLAQQLGQEGTPFFVAIAFAASGDFMTPIGYQTNMIIYGPGGYSFRDFFRVGLPLTIIYVITCITFIVWYYNLPMF